MRNQLHCFPTNLQLSKDIAEADELLAPGKTNRIAEEQAIRDSEHMQFTDILPVQEDVDLTRIRAKIVEEQRKDPLIITKLETNAAVRMGMEDGSQKTRKTTKARSTQTSRLVRQKTLYQLQHHPTTQRRTHTHEWKQTCNLMNWTDKQTTMKRKMTYPATMNCSQKMRLCSWQRTCKGSRGSKWTNTDWLVKTNYW